MNLIQQLEELNKEAVDHECYHDNGLVACMQEARNDIVYLLPQILDYIYDTQELMMSLWAVLITEDRNPLNLVDVPPVEQRARHLLEKYKHLNK